MWLGQLGGRVFVVREKGCVYSRNLNKHRQKEWSEIRKNLSCGALL